MARSVKPHPELEEGPAELLQLPWPVSGMSTNDGKAADHDDDDALLDGKDIFSLLRQNAFWSTQAQPTIDMLQAGADELQRVAEVFVIAFAAAESQPEGIYSLRTLNPEGLPQETIIGFECRQDAERYACLLEVTMEPHTPKIARLGTLDFVDFCRERSYRCLMEPPGSRAVPPESSVDVTDWERCKMFRAGQYTALEDYQFITDTQV